MSEVQIYGSSVHSTHGWGRSDKESEQPQKSQEAGASTSHFARAATEDAQTKESGKSGLVQDAAEKPSQRVLAPPEELAPLEAYRADDPQALAKAVERLQEFIDRVGRDLQFSVDDTTGKTVVKVYVTGTEEVVRQIPPEEMLSLAARLKEVQGILLNDRA